MPIEFICSCGKHLRAREAMAGRRSACPACGQPVGIPQLPSDDGRPPPLTPQERRRLARQRSATGSTATAEPDPGLDAQPLRPLDPADVRPPGAPKARRKRRPRREETRWYECLLFPFHAIRQVLGLAAFLTILSVTAVFVLPVVAGKLTAEDTASFGPPWLCVTLYVVTSLGVFVFAAWFFQLVLNPAPFEAQGTGPRRRVGREVVRAVALWLVCFLVGPVLPAAGGFFYWLYGGDFGVVDWVIVAELGVVAVGYWLLAVVAASRRGSLLDAGPWGVVAVVRGLGFRVLPTVGAAAVVILAHGLSVLLAMDQLRADGFPSVIRLALTWFSLVFFTTFLFRLLGMWCHRSPWWVAAPVAPPAAADAPPP